MRAPEAAPDAAGEAVPVTGLGHVGALDGLRGVAVAAVVAYHLGWVSGGFLGVDVFFVLSGFLVTSVVLAEVEGSGRLGLRAFWGRRVRRLLPAVVVLVPTVLAAAWLVQWPASRRDELAVDGLATLTWWANWRQIGGTSYWAPDPSPFRHAWSLSIEEQFYLAWPLLVVVALAVARRRGWSARAVVGAVAAAGALASTTWLTVLARALDADDLSRAYVGTDTRVAAPLVGCALACWWTGGRVASARARGVLVVAGHLGLLVLVVAVARVHVPDPGLYRNGGFALVAVAAGAVLLALVAEDGRPRSLGALAVATLGPVRHLGTRSYALYLWSWPIQALLQFWRPELTRGAVTLVVVPASLAAAEVSFALVEDPLRRRRGWATRPVLRRPAWAIGAAVALVAVGVAHRAAVPPPVVEQFDTAEAVERASTPPPPPLTTTTGADGSKPVGPPPLRVMVEGDSVAFTATYHGPSVLEMPPGLGTIDGRGVIGCGLLASAGWEYPRDDGGGFGAPAGGACRDQFEAERVGLTGDPDVVLVIAGAWEYQAVRSPEGDELAARSEELADALVEALLVRARAADAVGAAFAIAHWACPGAAADPERRDPGYITWVNAVFDRAAAEATDEGLRAGTLDPEPTICVDGEAEGEPTEAWRAATGDEVHVTGHEGGLLLWSSWLGPDLVALVDRVGRGG